MVICTAWSFGMYMRWNLLVIRSGHDGLTIALREVCTNDTIPHLREVLHKSECSGPWPRRVYKTERRRWGMCHTMLDTTLTDTQEKWKKKYQYII
jgi:hypothetical protein